MNEKDEIRNFVSWISKLNANKRYYRMRRDKANIKEINPLKIKRVKNKEHTTYQRQWIKISKHEQLHIYIILNSMEHGYD